MDNWLADWWDDVAYMAYRDPVVVYVSYFYVHKDGKGLGGRGDVGGGAERAARLIKAMMPFRALVEACVLLVPVLLVWLTSYVFLGGSLSRKR